MQVLFFHPDDTCAKSIFDLTIWKRWWRKGSELGYEDCGPGFDFQKKLEFSKISVFKQILCFSFRNIYLGRQAFLQFLSLSFPIQLALVVSHICTSFILLPLEFLCKLWKVNI